MGMWDRPHRQQLPCPKSALTPLPITAPLTGLGKCFFFNSLVAGLPYSLVFCQFWLFFVLKFVVVLLLVVRGGTVYLPMPASLAGSPSFTFKKTVLLAAL